MKDSKDNSKLSKDSAPISILQSVSVPAKTINYVLKVEKCMLTDATTLAFTIIWETASMGSTVFSPTPLKDKLLSPNLPKMSAVNYITKTIVLKETNADSLMISETNLAFLTHYLNANFQLKNADFHTKRKWK